LQGEEDAVIQSLRNGDVAAAVLDDRNRVLMEFVELVTRQAYRTTPEIVQGLRDAGWSDEQIAETVYVTGLFSMLNRVAGAFGLQDPNYEQMESPPIPAEQSKPEA
jgi:alkylhydroperoxidase family enzyme